MAEKWIETSAELPPEGVVVATKIDDDKGLRNEQPLKRQGNLFFHSDGSMYVYYRPTHWRRLTRSEQLECVLNEQRQIESEQRRLGERLEELSRAEARLVPRDLY